MANKKIYPFVSIVVLNWNGKRFIDLFIPSAINQTYPKDRYEIVFIDNASSDDSVDYLLSKYGTNKNLRVVQNDANYGYAKGNNLGVKTCTKSDFVLVCNNDLKLKEDLMESLVECAQKEQADLVVPKLMYLNKEGYINNAGSRLEPNSNWPIYEIGANEEDKGQYDKVIEISAFCGACVLFKDTFLKEVGLYDNKFFMYFEDGDLSWRGQKHGKKFVYSPRAIAYHHHTGSSKEGSPLFNHFVGRNRLLILTKNAKIKVVLSGWKAALKDHIAFRIKNLIASVRGKYGKKLALVEAARSAKMLGAALALTPYILLKRFGIIKEDRL